MKTNYQNASMLDMIFEHRNKSYGAYALRNNYSSRMSQALLITFSVISLLCFGKYLSDKMKPNRTTLLQHIVTADPIPEVHLEKPEIKIEQQKPPQSQALNTISDPEMHVTASNQTVDSMPTNEQLHDTESGTTTNLNGNTVGVTDGQGTQASFSEPVNLPPVATSVLNWAEVMPEFPGGEKKLMKFLSDHTGYPQLERDNDIEGKALVRFVVNEDGSISNVSVIKKDSPGFGKEAVRVVGEMPHFKPGSQQGEPVKVQFVLPFQFTLAK